MAEAEAWTDQRFRAACPVASASAWSRPWLRPHERVASIGFDQYPVDAMVCHPRLSEAEGMVVSDRETESSPIPPRRVYRITRQGEELLRTWVAASGHRSCSTPVPGGVRQVGRRVTFSDIRVC